MSVVFRPLENEAEARDAATLFSFKVLNREPLDEVHQRFIQTQKEGTLFGLYYKNILAVIVTLEMIPDQKTCLLSNLVRDIGAVGLQIENKTLAQHTVQMACVYAKTHFAAEMMSLKVKHLDLKAYYEKLGFAATAPDFDEPESIPMQKML